MKNLNALRDLDFHCFSQTNTRLQNDLIDSLKTTIEKISFHDSSFKLDLSKIDRSISISFYRNNEDLDFDFIHKLYKYINKFKISRSNYDNLLKLLSDQNFANLKELQISYCDFSRLERKMFNGSFPAIRKLSIWSNEYLEIIDHDAFSNLKQLRHLNIDGNPIESLDERTFSDLVNLHTLYLSNTRLKIIDRNMFSNLKKLKQIDTYPSKLI